MIETEYQEHSIFSLFNSPYRYLLLLCAVVMAFCSGCISVKSYVDPQLPKVSYTSLKTTGQKHPVQVFFEFQNQNGTNAAVTEKIRPKVVAVLEKSNLFSGVVTTPKTADQKLFLTMKNFPVTKDAASKGAAVGLTFGLAGTMVTDGYSMEALYQAPSRHDVKKSYRHALHSTIGNADGPPGLQPMSLEEGFDKVLEELLLNVLNDLSREGDL